MNRRLYPCLSQDFKIKVDSESVESNSPFQFKSISPRPPKEPLFETNLISNSDLSEKLVFINNTKKNPLAYTTLFRNIIDDEIKTRLSASSTKDLLNFYKIRAEEEVTNESFSYGSVEFSSNFESGNLFKAYFHSENEYVLLLRPDYGNPKYTHWFFFKVKVKKPEKVTFHIANIAKKDLGLMKGQKIVVKKGENWERLNSEIVFEENHNFKDYTRDEFGYVLSFSYQFESKSEVFFAYSFPYTYTHLANWLSSLKHAHHDILSISTLTHTLHGTPCEMLTITSEVHSYLELKKNQISEKKAIIFMGRVHPSESPASYIMQGLISFLLSKSFEAKTLRKNFVFKIIPMLNPDGVKYGNSRCCLLGIDLNRRWNEANEVLHPEIFAAKEMIKNIQSMHEIVMYCDIHSHAKKRNVFMYGCRISNPDKSSKKKNMVAKLIPILLAKKNSNFSFKDSNFKMEKDKESTGRIVMYKEFGIINSYTIETSFFGRDNNESFSISDWESIGNDLGFVCLSLANPLTLQSSLRAALDWYKKQKAPKKKLVKANKLKNKKNKEKINEENNEENDFSFDEANDLIEDEEKLPEIHSPQYQVLKLEKKERNKASSIQKKGKNMKSQRCLKGSLDQNSSRKCIESFPSLDIFSDSRKIIELKSKFSSTIKLKKNKEKLPAIK